MVSNSLYASEFSICNNPECLRNKRTAHDCGLVVMQNRTHLTSPRYFCSWECLIVFAENPTGCAITISSRIRKMKKSRENKTRGFTNPLRNNRRRSRDDE